MKKKLRFKFENFKIIYQNGELLGYRGQNEPFFLSPPNIGTKNDGILTMINNELKQCRTKILPA